MSNLIFRLTLFFVCGLLSHSSLAVDYEEIYYKGNVFTTHSHQTN